MSYQNKINSKLLVVTNEQKWLNIQNGIKLSYNTSMNTLFIE